jgi:SpoVK/Ycf46/Vps4 family AAA+-type ATPase
MAGDFATTVANLFKARFPLLYIPTWEEARVVAKITEIAADSGKVKTPRKVFTWSATKGLLGGNQASSEETKSPLKAIEAAELCEDAAVFILKDFHTLLGGNGKPLDTQVVRRLRDAVPVLRESSKPKCLIIVAPVLALPNDLQKDVEVVDFDLPTFDEVVTILRGMVEANKARGKIRIDLAAADYSRLASAALGLTLQEAENAFARAMVDDGVLDANDVDVILEEKRQIIRKTQILEFIKSSHNLDDVGGLDNLKRWLRKRNRSWLEEARRYCLPPPKGVLIAGVPGCGKSLIAKSISEMWKLPLLRLDVGRIFSGVVGSSEENIRTAIKTAEALAPSILWIDEIEKGFSGVGSSGDSGTSTRVFGTFLTWMQEKTKAVFVVATANNIHALPAEMLRKGRFDEIFFVDLPTKSERATIIDLHLKKRLRDKDVLGSFVPNSDVTDRLASMTEGFVGAELENMVIAALFEAFSEQRAITLADFEKAVRNTVPLSVTQAEQIHAIREWANLRAVSATLQEHRAEYSQASSSKEPADVSAARGGRTVDF